MTTSWKNVGVFGVAVAITLFVWVILGRQPEVAAMVYGIALFVTFGVYWISLLKDVATSTTKQGERLMKFIGRLAIGSVLFAVIVMLLAGLIGESFKSLYDKVAHGDYGDLFNPATYSHQLMVVVLSAIVAYALVVPATRWLALTLAGVTCLGCLLVPVLIAKHPELDRAAGDAAIATSDAITAKVVKARNAAEADKAEAERNRLAQQAKDAKAAAITDVEVALLLAEMQNYEATAESPLEITITTDGVRSFTDQYDGNEEIEAKGSIFTLKPSRDWLKNLGTGHIYVPFFRGTRSAVLRYFRHNDVGPFIQGAIKRKKLALEEASGGVRGAPSSYSASSSGLRASVASVGAGVTTPVPVPAAPPARSMITFDRVRLEPAVNRDDWTATQIVAYDDETISYWPQGGKKKDVARLSVRSGDAAPIHLVPINRSGDVWYGIVQWKGANSVSQPMRLQLEDGDPLIVELKKE